MTVTYTNWPGWAALRRHWLLGFVLYAITTVVSLPAAIAVGALVNGYFKNREVADQVSATWSLVPMFEMMTVESTSLTVIGAVVVATTVGWLFVQAFIAGAVLGSNRDTRPSTLKRALAYGGQNLVGLVSLSILGVPFVAAVVGAVFWGAGKLAGIFNEGSTSEESMIMTRLVLYGAAIVVATWALGTYDLMRARKVEGANLIWAFAAGLMQGLLRPQSILLRALPWTVLALAATAIVSVVDAQRMWTTPAAMVVGIAMQQGLVLLRVYLRVAGMSSVQGLLPVEPTK